MIKETISKLSEKKNLTEIETASTMEFIMEGKATTPQIKEFFPPQDGSADRMIFIFPSIERKEAIELPDALVKEIVPEGDTHLEEERRLFYAMVHPLCRHVADSAFQGGGHARETILMDFVVFQKHRIPSASHRTCRLYRAKTTCRKRNITALLIICCSHSYPSAHFS